MKTQIKKIGALLVVEDNNGDQEILKQAFSALGIVNEIIIVDNGVEALKYF